MRMHEVDARYASLRFPERRIGKVFRNHASRSIWLGRMIEVVIVNSPSCQPGFDVVVSSA